MTDTPSPLARAAHARPGGDAQAGPLRIVHVMGSLDDPNAGPSYSIPALCRALSEAGHAVALHAVTAAAERLESDAAGYEDRRHPAALKSWPALGKLGVSTALRDAVADAAAGADAVHTHGLWRCANVYPAHAARRYGKPLVLSPRGMLAPNALQFSAVSKRFFWALAQRRAAGAVALFHATSAGEHDDIRAYGLTQPIAVIPNGIDLPDAAPAAEREGELRTVAFLGRLHPVKAIDRLIKAWSLLGDAAAGWRLAVIGPAEQGHDAELRALAARLGLSAVDFCGPARGAEKWRALGAAEISVLPSLSENFGVSVAESLASGTPVIASRGTPWSELEPRGCGWWVDNAPESLAAALAEAMALSDTERAAMGRRGREWMEAAFAWRGVAAQMADVYAWLARGGETPACVKQA